MRVLFDLELLKGPFAVDEKRDAKQQTSGLPRHAELLKVVQRSDAASEGRARMRGGHRQTVQATAEVERG